MPNSPEHGLLLELQDLIPCTETVADFLSGLSRVAAEAICTQAEAMAVLVNASSHRNQKLRDLAEEMILRSSGNKLVTFSD